ncbi:DgyrCDS7755 [Dimorphilus gyrociliatus]|uniref:DgyrCDS7755 n=1 Tax=Dimorphilus gyrociliatus TaxID=2664684 RepID=A0A7I8VS15_9ANNE|nr:DgyrCDS7755 [Dimorphilus gyrociliatus]
MDVIEGRWKVCSTDENMPKVLKAAGYSDEFLKNMKSGNDSQLIRTVSRQDGGMKVKTENNGVVIEETLLKPGEETAGVNLEGKEITRKLEIEDKTITVVETYGGKCLKGTSKLEDGKMIITLQSGDEKAEVVHERLE